VIDNVRRDYMNVAFIFFLKDSFGGAERRLTRIYNELCAEDKTIECDIVVRGCDRERALEFFKQADCDISNISRVIAFKSPLVCLLYIFFARKYKLIHFFSACGYNFATQIVCKISRKKSLYTICGYREAYNSFPESHMKKVRRQLQMADYIDLLYPSGGLFVSQYIKKGKMSITPGTFTDLEVFRPMEKRKTIVYAAARLNDSKNPFLFIEGIELCKEMIRTEGYKVYILGKGDCEESIKSYIKRKSLSDIVQMIGYDKTSKYLPMASVFCSLQKLENYPSQSLAEAAASGCYLIITDVGDSRKCAEDTFATFINNDPSELCAALCKYFSLSLDDKKAIVNDARCFSLKNYSIEASKHYFKSLFKSAENDT